MANVTRSKPERAVPAGAPRRKTQAAVAAAPRKENAKQATLQPAAGGPRIKIRMYRLGVGDCFLVRLPRPDRTDFRMLIDCGVHAAQTGGKDRIRAAVQDILELTRETEGGKGRLDVIVGTHEHWDHLSGFFHAPDLFEQFEPCPIWCAWTEDQNDAFAVSLQQSRGKGVTALWGAVARLRFADAYGPQPATGEPSRDWDGVLGFFGDSAGVGVKAKKAAEEMRKRAKSEADIHYRNPGEPPFDGVSEDWRVFVLGPPRDGDLIERSDPRAGSGEVYSIGATAMAAANFSATVSAEDDPPFDARYALPLEATRDRDRFNEPAWQFFHDRYWADRTPDRLDHEAGTDANSGDEEAREEAAQDWRRIGYGWLDGAEALALKLDKDTNNTSLVLAIELGPRDSKDNPVILFAADAQVGNWLSWQNVKWPDYAGREVSGPDLLRRTIIYKVGHHASHNATLMQGGLETMTRLRLALVPTDLEMAKKVGWGTLPWPSLLKRLATVTGDRVLRSDTGASVGLGSGVSLPSGFTLESPAAAGKQDLYFDITYTPSVATTGPAPGPAPAR